MSEIYRLKIGAQLKGLPRWAAVAFAARCARRVYPLVESSASLDEHAEARVLHAITFAEQSAAIAAGYGGAAAANAVNARFAANPGAVAAAVNAAAAAANAAAAAAAAAATGLKATPAPSAALAAYQSQLASSAMRDPVGDGSAIGAASTAIEDDLQRLIELTRSDGWTDATPVPQTVFGDLWPQRDTLKEEPGRPTEPTSSGEPTPLVSPTASEVPLEVYIDPGDASVETIAEMFEALSALHRAAGGSGLRFRTDGNSVFAMKGALQ